MQISRSLFRIKLLALALTLCVIGLGGCQQQPLPITDIQQLRASLLLASFHQPDSISLPPEGVVVEVIELDCGCEYLLIQTGVDRDGEPIIIKWKSPVYLLDGTPWPCPYPSYGSDVIESLPYSPQQN